MVRKGLLVVGFWLLVFGVVSGQEWTFGEVEKLPATVNSAAEESMPILSPDGKTLYFTRIMCEDNLGGKFAGPDIWVSEFDGRNWSKADNRGVPFNDKKKNNAVVGMSADGKTVYLMDASPNRKIHGIHFSKHINGKWTDPELIPIDGIASDGFVGFYVSPDFDVILISMKGADSRGEEDLYVCLRDGSGRWSRPRNLGPSINTAGFEISPFLTADKKRLFFSSNGHQGLGDGDIFYCDRLYDSWETWTVARNLGEGVNSKQFDGYLGIYGDTLTYFVSNRENNFANVYEANAAFTHRVNQHLLTSDEKRELFGIDFSSVIRFEENSSELLTSHRELLWYIGGKLIGKYNIKIRIDTPATENNSILEKRVTAIVAQLALAGLEGSRIFQSDFSKANNTLGKDEIELTFVK